MRSASACCDGARSPAGLSGSTSRPVARRGAGRPPGSGARARRCAAGSGRALAGASSTSRQRRSGRVGRERAPVRLGERASARLKVGYVRRGSPWAGAQRARTPRPARRRRRAAARRARTARGRTSRRARRAPAAPASRGCRARADPRPRSSALASRPRPGSAWRSSSRRRARAPRSGSAGSRRPSRGASACAHGIVTWGRAYWPAGRASSGLSAPSTWTRTR